MATFFLPGLAPFDVTLRKQNQKPMIPGLKPANLQLVDNQTPISARVLPRALNTAVGMMGGIVKQIRTEHPSASYVTVTPDGISGVDSATAFTEQLINEGAPFVLVINADHDRFR